MDLPSLRRALVEHGFDVVAETSLAAYHAAVPPAFRLPWDDANRIVLIGASRAIWPHFMAALAREPWRREAAHPFDGWAAPLLSRLVADAVGRTPHDLYHYAEAPPRRVALQHLAEVAGVAGRAPCGLSIHPELGLWFALRAALVVAEAPHAEDGTRPSWPCASCVERPCLPPFERALAASSRPGPPQVEAALWLAVREACPVGRAAHYTDDQIRWHHFHDRAALSPPRAAASRSDDGAEDAV